MEERTIREVAREAEVKPSTLRYYESIGLLAPQERINGQRRYDDEALKRLSIIKMAKQAGFTLKEIDTLMSGFSDDEPPSARWKVLANEKLREMDAIISQAEDMKKILEEGINCDCLSLDECVTFFNRKFSKNKVVTAHYERK
ncbi:MAG: MerR family transcriptional regulator [Anaerolineae bacterium]|nr:MerR family transcriptional regulator [Anaerolineae bacterium]MDK1082002.1 MerR family transcriptional regulator [Anaerolineae bacterium]MDK1119318.1 MerR family transcriptional regulator [Anaerolineae bacterium]